MEQEVERFEVVDRTHLRFVSALDSWFVCVYFSILYHYRINFSPKFPRHFNVRNILICIQHFDYSQTIFRIEFFSPLLLVFLLWQLTFAGKRGVYASAIFISIDFLLIQLVCCGNFVVVKIEHEHHMQRSQHSPLTVNFRKFFEHLMCAKHIVDDFI